MSGGVQRGGDRTFSGTAKRITLLGWKLPQLGLTTETGVYHQALIRWTLTSQPSISTLAHKRADGYSGRQTVTCNRISKEVEYTGRILKRKKKTVKIAFSLQVEV